MHNLLIYMVIKVFKFLPAATGAAEPRCSGTVNAAD